MGVVTSWSPSRALGFGGFGLSLCGTRYKQVSVLGGAVWTRVMAEPVRDLSLGGAEGLGVPADPGWELCRAEMAQGMDTQRAQGLCRAVPSGSVRATPALSPQVPPAQPYCPLHPISQPPASAPSTQLPPASPSAVQHILLVLSHKPAIPSDPSQSPPPHARSMSPSPWSLWLPTLPQQEPWLLCSAAQMPLTSDTSKGTRDSLDTVPSCCRALCLL